MNKYVVDELLDSLIYNLILQLLLAWFFQYSALCLCSCLILSSGLCYIWNKYQITERNQRRRTHEKKSKVSGCPVWVKCTKYKEDPKWYKATATKYITKNDSYHVIFDDEDIDANVPMSNIRFGRNMSSI